MRIKQLYHDREEVRLCAHGVGLASTRGFLSASWRKLKRQSPPRARSRNAGISRAGVVPSPVAILDAIAKPRVKAQADPAAGRSRVAGKPQVQAPASLPVVAGRPTNRRAHDRSKDDRSEGDPRAAVGLGVRKVHPLASAARVAELRYLQWESNLIRRLPSRISGAAFKAGPAASDRSWLRAVAGRFFGRRQLCTGAGDRCRAARATSRRSNRSLRDHGRARDRRSRRFRTPTLGLATKWCSLTSCSGPALRQIPSIAAITARQSCCRTVSPP